jgi:hypothetical protein
MLMTGLGSVIYDPTHPVHWHSANHCVITLEVMLEHGLISERKQPSDYVLAYANGQPVRSWQRGLFLPQFVHGRLAPSWAQEQRFPEGLRSWLSRLSQIGCVAVEWTDTTNIRAFRISLELEAVSAATRSCIVDEPDAYLTNLVRIR